MPVPISHTRFRPVEGSQVNEFLEKLDDGFNPRNGLFDLNRQRVSQVVPAGKVLLGVHGTFSKGDAILGHPHRQTRQHHHPSVPDKSRPARHHTLV
ncbi:MAG TPA: hypothetical protein VN283_12125 [Thiobacillus sp.]|nr:hypothetical protein [Thiobacillus sp.]